MQWGRAEGERVLSKMHAEQEAQPGAQSHNSQIMTGAETQNRSLH